MKVIIPMAGHGKRMRPHTLTVPKPLIIMAGKPIVQRIVEEIAKVFPDKIEEIAFVVGDFGKDVEDKLSDIAQTLGAKARIYYQDEALGTGHAIHCAKESLNGKVIVAFADTLFKADFKLKEEIEASIWVQKVDDPGSFGVVKLNKDNCITGFVEKPKDFVSDLAIIGIYYFRDGEKLKTELQYLIDNNVMVNGEYQLTEALINMNKKGVQFSPGQVIEWLDCGNKDATVYTHQRILEYHKSEKLISDSLKNNNSIIIEPCYIGDNVVVTNSLIGPHVSVGSNSVINGCIVKNSIIQNDTILENINIQNSMIGSNVEFKEEIKEVSLGDFTSVLK